MEYKEKQEKSAVYQEADVSSKRIFGNHTLCAQFLRDYAGLPVLANVQPEDIEDVSERYHLFREVQLESDTVKKVHLKEVIDQTTGQCGQELYIISLIEHKSEADYDVTMQILRYMVCIWENTAKEQSARYDILQRAPADVVEIIVATIRDLCEKLNLPTEETSNYVRKVRAGNMGYLFENMEKMDIQLERRNTAEQRERAEKAEQKVKEAVKEVHSMCHMLVQSYQQQGIDKETVRKRRPPGVR